MEPKASGQDEIFLQGTIDVFFEDAEGRIVLLDYKTDRATKPELIRKRYQKQLDLYVRAIQEITGMKVDEKFIYCLSDGSTIAM
jgi:ATP-dependent helicase/nuclease subunit A